VVWFVFFAGAGGGGAKSSIFVFLSVTLLNGRGCANDFAIKAFEYGNAFDTVG